MVFFSRKQATLAAKLCKDGAQYRNNQNNYDRLLHYFNRFRTIFPVEEGSKSEKEFYFALVQKLCLAALIHSK